MLRGCYEENCFRGIQAQSAVVRISCREPGYVAPRDLLTREAKLARTHSHDRQSTQLASKYEVTAARRRCTKMITTTSLAVTTFNYPLRYTSTGLQGESKRVVTPLRLLHIFPLVASSANENLPRCFAIYILTYVPILVHLSQYL